MKRILIVDDNPLDLKLISSLLKNSFNVTIEHASDGIEALECMLAERYDLLITDIIMPKIEGIELINKVQTQKLTTNIVAVSSGKPFYLYLAKKLGIQAVFTKPINKIQFIDKIGQILGMSALANNPA